MAYENNEKRVDSVYSQRVRAGKRRTYFFDVRETRGNDYYLTITESRKKFNEDGYDRHKIFLYKEDFNKFLKGITEAIDYVKVELMPDFDFDIFSHENDEYQQGPRTSNPDESQPPKQEEEKASTPDDAPTGIAAAATPELDSDSDKPTPDATSDSSGASDADSSDEDTSHHDEHVDKW